MDYYHLFRAGSAMQPLYAVDQEHFLKHRKLLAAQYGRLVHISVDRLPLESHALDREVLGDAAVLHLEVEQSIDLIFIETPF